MKRLWDLFWYGYSHQHTYEVIREVKDFTYSGSTTRPSSIIIVSRCTTCGKIIKNTIN